MNDKGIKLEKLIEYGSREAVKAKLLSESGFCLEEKQIDCLDYLVYQIG